LVSRKVCALISGTVKGLHFSENDDDDDDNNNNNNNMVMIKIFTVVYWSQNFALD